MESEAAPSVEKKDDLSLLESALDNQEKTFGRRWILFADIDNTSYKVGVNNQPLRQRIEQGQWGVVNITGRGIQHVVELIQQDEISIPHAVATRGGTRFYILKPESLSKKPQDITVADFIESNDFRQLSTNKGFNKLEVRSKAKVLMPKWKQEFPEFDLRFQDHETEETYLTEGLELDPTKLSFDLHIPSSTPLNRLDSYLATIQKEFPHLRLLRTVKNVNSTEAVWFIDIVPFSKDKIIQDLSTNLNAKGLIAGDSGNDMFMLTTDYHTENIKDFIRATVGGSSPEILDYFAAHDVTGGKTWQRLDHTDGMRVYQENGSKRLGPESLAHVMEMLEKAWRISHIKNRLLQY